MLCRQIGFQRGQANPSVRGKPRDYEPSAEKSRYVRTTFDTFDSRIHEKNNGVLTFKDVDGHDTPVKPLRPLKCRSRLLDQYLETAESNIQPDLLVNKLYCPYYVQLMFNTEIKRHIEIQSECNGNLEIDVKKSLKWGLGWRERLICPKCPFQSEYYILYEEVKVKKRGRRAAKVNVGLQIGLMTTPISNVGACRILATSNIIPPSRSGMIKQSNKVNDSLVQLNNESMKDIRQKLVRENENCGNKNAIAVNIEGDSCYNNPIFNAESTPFQAGTIVTTTFCENNTRNKQVVGVFIGNKLCRVASKLNNDGQNVKCPNHAGHCTANLEMTETIGNEEKWNIEVCKAVQNDISISTFTSDGDSKGCKGVSKATSSNATCLKDLRHLGNSLKRQIYKAPFSSKMFSRSRTTNLKNRFALSVKARCIAELKQAHSIYNSDLDQIRQVIPSVKEAIIMCFNGNCGETCKKHSLVCKGEYRQEKFFLPPSTKLTMTESDECLMSKCMDVLLGSSNLQLTAQMSSTQKCEAVNKSYQACNPKCVTFSRTCSGRIHGQILKLNTGFADSTLLKTSALGATLTKGSSVIKHIAKMQRSDQYYKKTCNKVRKRLMRYKTLSRKYTLHANLHYSKGLTDPKPNFSDMKHLQDHKLA